MVTTVYGTWTTTSSLLMKVTSVWTLTDGATYVTTGTYSGIYYSCSGYQTYVT